MYYGANQVTRGKLSQCWSKPLVDYCILEDNLMDSEKFITLNDERGVCTTAFSKCIGTFIPQFTGHVIT